MVLGFHCIFTTYGTWLPNEPRGSWSTYVASWELFRFGPATKVDTRQSVAHQPFDRNAKNDMQNALKHEPVKLTGEQVIEVANAFAGTAYTFHALAIMPNHVHAVIGRVDRPIRTVVGHVKSEATRSLRAKGWFAEHTPWTVKGWNVYLDDVADVQRAISYVEQNPVREGLKLQNWSFVQGYR